MFYHRNDKDEVVRSYSVILFSLSESGSASWRHKKSIPMLYTLGTATELREILQPNESKD